MQRSDAAWSIPPVGAPATTFSARSHAAASRARPSSERPSPNPARSSTAIATAHSRAADDDRPAPTGTWPSTQTSRPGGSRSSSASAQRTPAMYADHPRGRPGPMSRRSPSQPSSLWAERTRSRPSSRARAGHESPLRQGDRQAEPGVVVGVLAHQVDPAGRRPDTRWRARRPSGSPRPPRRRAPLDSPRAVHAARPRHGARDGTQPRRDPLGSRVVDPRAHARLRAGEVLQLAGRAQHRDQLQVQPGQVATLARRRLVPAAM